MTGSYSYISREEIARQLREFFGRPPLLVLYGILHGTLLGPWKEWTQIDTSRQVGRANMKRYRDEVIKYAGDALMAPAAEEVVAVLVKWVKDDERGAVAQMWLRDRTLWANLLGQATSGSTANIFAGILCEFVVEAHFIAIGHGFDEEELVEAQADDDIFAVKPADAVRAWLENN